MDGRTARLGKENVGVFRRDQVIAGLAMQPNGDFIGHGGGRKEKRGTVSQHLCGHFFQT